MRNVNKIIATVLSMVSMVGLVTYDANTIMIDNQIQVSAETDIQKAEQLFNLVNDYRKIRHLQPFKTCSVMNEMANVRAKEIVGGIYISRGDNQYYNTIFDEYNIKPSAYNQNTYWGGVGYDSPEYALNELKQSERQNNNMLSTEYEYMGVGVYVDTTNNRTYYYQLFCTSSDLEEDIVTTSVTTQTTTITTTAQTQSTTENGISDAELQEKYNLDVNKNGVVNAIDLMILKKYLLGDLKS
ncbi:MAG: CAP domain-containing protein [Oscillospiraceae bacterium]